MAITLRKTIAARELPDDWQSEGQFAPGDRVTVTVTTAAPDVPRGSLRRFIGVGHGLFGSRQAVDEHIERQRDEWAS